MSQGHHRNPPLKNLKKKWKFEWSVRIIFKEKIKEINTTLKKYMAEIQHRDNETLRSIIVKCIPGVEIVTRKKEPKYPWGFLRSEKGLLDPREDWSAELCPVGWPLNPVSVRRGHDFRYPFCRRSGRP